MRALAFWSSVLLIFVIPWEDMVFIQGAGTVGRAAGMLVGVVWLGTVIIQGRVRRPHPFHIAVFLFLLWNAWSVLWSLDIDRTVARIVTYVQLAAMTFILWDLYRSPKALRVGLQSYILGVYVSIGSTLANFLRGQEETYLRYAATGFNPNDVGLIVALGIPVAWHLVASPDEDLRQRNPVLLVANWIYIPAAVVTILLTASRGSLVAAVPGFVYMLATIPRLSLRLRVLALVALVALFFAVQAVVPQYSLERLATTGSSIAEGDLTGRTDIWYEGIGAFLEHPLLGVGSGAFRMATQAGKVAHSVFISVLVEVGVIGFVLFAAVLAVVFYQALRQPKWRSRFWLAVLAVWTVGAVVHTWEYRKPTWLFLTLAVASASLVAPAGETEAHAEALARPAGPAGLSHARPRGDGV